MSDEEWGGRLPEPPHNSNEDDQNEEDQSQQAAPQPAAQPHAPSAARAAANRGMKALGKQVANKALNAASKTGIQGAIAAQAAKVILDKNEREKMMRRAAILILLDLAIAIGILALLAIPIILLIGIFGGLGNKDQSTNEANVMKLTLSKTGPAATANAGNYDYTITYAFPLPAQDLVITDKLPQGVDYVSSPAKKINYDTATKTITWKLSENQPPDNGNVYNSINGSFTFTVHTTLKDTTVFNLGAEGTIIGATAGNNLPINVARSKNDCNGRYDLSVLPNNENFGDPQCTFNYTDLNEREKLFTILKNLDPEHATDWFVNIVSCESGYNPNAYNGNSTSGKGAYGLFQMNPAPRVNIGRTGATGPQIYDIGDVVWNQQADNAVHYNEYLIKSGKQFCYWECAKRLWPASGC
jgi:hypothetical protein